MQYMETFLKQVAADLYRKMNGDFTKVAVVFPNKRASLFSMNIWHRNPTARYGRRPT